MFIYCPFKNLGKFKFRLGVCLLFPELLNYVSAFLSYARELVDGSPTFSITSSLLDSCAVCETLR